MGINALSFAAVPKVGIYTPRQIGFGSFFFGPLVAVCFLKKNFDSLGDQAGSKKVVIYGGIFLVVFLALLPFIPEKVPQIIFPIAVALTAQMIAEKYQLKKGDIIASEAYRPQSNWKVFGLSLVYCFLYVIPACVWIAFVLQMEEEIHLEQLWS